jgi:cytoskeletal protein CcmA (bactofilin family)
MFQKVIGHTPATPPAAPALPAAAPSAPSSASAPFATAATAARPASSASRNVLSTDVEVKGTLKFTNDLIVDGRIEGEIQSDGNLTIGENARIKAEIKTATVTVHGKVHGNITATDRVDLKAGAEVVGDIKAKVLAMEPGAIFVGKATVGTPTSTPTAPNSGNNPAAKA